MSDAVVRLSRTPSVSDAVARLSGSDYVASSARLLAAAGAGACGLQATVVVPAALVLGSAQHEDDVEPSARQRLAVVRRGTGGGAVRCDEGVLLIDLAVPRGHPLAPADVTEAYRPIGTAIVCVLQRLGVPCRTVTVAEARAAGAAQRAAARHACWAGLSPYEVVLADGRKLVGLAQRRRSGAVLHQIAIPVASAPRAVAAFLVAGGDVEPWLDATASLHDVPSCAALTPDQLWTELHAPLGSALAV